MQEQLRKTERELKVRNYSPKTIKVYLYGLKKYFSFKKEGFNDLDKENIIDFLLFCKKNNVSSQTRNLFLNAIKFYYYNIVKTSQKINIRTAKKNQKLPIVLSKKEIAQILKATSNRKHRILLALAYGAGLRISEVLNLKVKDVDLEGLTVYIENTKGKKDRISTLPKKLVNGLKVLMANKSSNDFVFESNRGGSLSTRTGQKIFKKAKEKAGLQKNATFHSLRHSFATHLLENGVDVRYVQELLGHRNIRTTQRYTKVTNPQLKNIKSPL